METVVTVGIVLVVALVTASGAWVGCVLIATIARVQRSARSVPHGTVGNVVEPPGDS